MIANAFSPDSNQPRVVVYQAILALKHTFLIESLDLEFRAKLISIIIPQIETNNYDLFFDIVYALMK